VIAEKSAIQMGCADTKGEGDLKLFATSSKEEEKDWRKKEWNLRHEGKGVFGGSIVCLTDNTRLARHGSESVYG